ncbi:MAG TPA: hypothetical protein VF846_16510 [Thermoanaerobaculia bacterium]|jgi:hypothetical protein
MLTIRLTRQSPTHHLFQYARPDGSGESAELETKTFLYHDLLHFAVESEASLTSSFYGLLARGETFKNLRELSLHQPSEIATTERVVGMLTGLFKNNDSDFDDVVMRAIDMLRQIEESAPLWLTPALVTNVQERMRRLLGEWKATRFGKTMTLRFEPAEQ